MFCEKCGGELRQEENKLVCTKCGAENRAESDVQTPSAEYVVPRGLSAKKNIIIIIVAALLMAGIVGAIVAVNVTKSSSQTAPGGIQVAERYLSEQNYEQAVIEFEKILEIEPMNVDAYFGLAEAYIGLGDTEKALEMLRKGFDMTGDARLQARIDELTKVEEPVVSSSSSSSEPVYGSMGVVTIQGVTYDIATTTELELGGMGLTDEEIKSLSGFTNLTYLSLRDNQISDISAFSGFTNLTYLDLENNQISDISALSWFTNLTYLDLENNQISDISALSGLTNLTYLDLGRNQISDISALSGLLILTYLELGYNQISDISALSELTNLTELYLLVNQISDISALSGLTNLTELWLSSNHQISDISALSRLTNLTCLYLDYNQISESDKAWLKEKLPNCDISF